MWLTKLNKTQYHTHTHKKGFWNIRFSLTNYNSLTHTQSVAFVGLYDDACMLSTYSFEGEEIGTCGLGMAIVQTH